MKKLFFAFVIFTGAMLAILGFIMLVNYVSGAPISTLIPTLVQPTQTLYPTRPIQVQPTATERTMYPTWTQIPSKTPMPTFTATLINTAVPTKKIVPTSAPKRILPDCSAQYAYIASLHQFYLNQINTIYQPQISYYEELIQEATAQRDGLQAIRLTRYLDDVKASLDASVNSENSRYEADKAYLNAQCK